jgi:hypothetical protein
MERRFQTQKIIQNSKILDGKMSGKSTNQSINRSRGRPSYNYIIHVHEHVDADTIPRENEQRSISLGGSETKI